MQPPRLYLWNSSLSIWEPDTTGLTGVTSLGGFSPDGHAFVYTDSGGGILAPASSIASGDYVDATSSDGTALCHVWDGSTWIPAEGDLTPQGILGDDAHWWWWGAGVTTAGDGSPVTQIQDQVISVPLAPMNVLGGGGPIWRANWGDGLPAFDSVSSDYIYTALPIEPTAVEDIIIGACVQRDSGTANGVISACCGGNVSGAVQTFMRVTASPGNGYRGGWLEQGTASTFSTPVAGTDDGGWHTVVMRRVLNGGTGLYEWFVSVDGGAEEGPNTNNAQVPIPPTMRAMYGVGWAASNIVAGSALSSGAGREMIVWRGTASAAQASRLHAGMRARSIP